MQPSTHESASARISTIIATLAHESESSIEIQELITIIGRRAFSLIMITFATFNILPISFIPGVSFITGIPIAIVGLQLLIGKTHLWLPQLIARKKLPRQNIITTLTKGLPVFQKIEYLLKPRGTFLFRSLPLKLLGLVIIIVSTALMLPIPFSNNILGTLIILLALSLLEYDGAILLATLLVTISYFILIYCIGAYLISVLHSLY